MYCSKFSTRGLRIFTHTIFILVTILPLALVVFIPIFIFRYFVSKWSNCFIKSHGNILSPLSTVFALDDLTGQPASTILLSLTLKGQPELTQVIKRFQRIIESGYYPELQQSLTMWLGFYFWKWNPDFSLENHIDFLNKPMTSKNVQNLTRSLLKKPFKNDMPLWNVTVLTNINFDSECKTSKTSLCILRFHHCLVDGNSLYKLATQLTDKKSWTQSRPNFPSRTIWAKILSAVKLIVYGPFELISTILESHDQNEWRLSTVKAGSQTQQNSMQHKGMRLKCLKSIAKSQDVTTTAVIMSLLTGAIRQMMKKYSEPENVPDTISILCAWPMKNPPDRKLTNYTTISPIKVPISEPDDFRRLSLIQKELTRLKYSTLPYGFYVLSYLTGSIFPWLIKRMNSGSIGTVVFSNFPGPEDNNIEVFGDGIKVTELIVNVGVPRGFPMGFVSVGFNGTLAITNGSSKNLFPSEEMAQEFMNLVLREFDIMKRWGDV